ncbi:MAG TPA: Gfo/Idh/MocA family oxidoreductase [Devosia sp.]|jgi:predicted dehydrogenase|uniref:Gfo/Idh/MocA family protein n=1 Tax=Devosia sp. TaxID=1871048 RepID=UPI002DDCF430|nr:Gfo/Idh/MocA family oxidoreductase [Devosia sp.]HEV2518653.1 Gfo/Idh/MocA family oxidoreductase [Devosia sp.]
MPQSTPRFGFIGTGIWVSEVQAPAAAGSDAVRFTSVYGRNATAATAIATAHGATAYADLAGFLDSVDIVGIALPPSAQPEFALAAIAAGKHLLLEKPVAIEVGAARRIADGLDEKGLKSLVFFTGVLNRRSQAWLADVHEVGGWVGGRVDAFSGVLVDPANPFHSTARWRAGTGALWDTVPHAVAMLTQVFGPVVEVTASAGLGDLKAAVLSHRDGGLTTINLAMDMPSSVPGETVIYGKAGKREMPMQVLDWRTNARQVYGEALAALVASIEGQPTTHPDARFGAYVTAVIAAIERALAERRSVAVE